MYTLKQMLRIMNTLRREGCQKNYIIEKVHLKYLKSFLKENTNTLNQFFLYGKGRNLLSLRLKLELFLMIVKWFQTTIRFPS